MNHQVETPKLLILAQKRTGSHYLQKSIKCASLTGTTFVEHVRNGGTVDESLYQKHNTDNMSVQFLRFHDFSTIDRHYVDWHVFANDLIDRAGRIVVLTRRDRFMHALTDYFGNEVFDRELKRSLSHDDWTKYRENTIQDYDVNPEKIEYYFKRANVFYKLFSSLYMGNVRKCLFIGYEDFKHGNVVSLIERVAGYLLAVDNPPEWKPADYSKLPNIDKLRELCGDYINKWEPGIG